MPVAPRPWLDSYPPGVPHEIDARAFESLNALFERGFERYRDLPAFVNLGVALSYGELERLSRAFGAFLLNDLGLARGDRVAIMLPNLLQYPVALSGFKAYPTEIEDVALLHPGVKDAGVAGVPDARSGEAVALYIVKRDPALTAEALREHCARHLAPYKRPKLIEFRDQLPKSAIGKILHRELRP